MLNEVNRLQALYLIHSFCLSSSIPNAFMSNNFSFLKIKPTKEGLFHTTLYHVQQAAYICGSFVLFCIFNTEKKMKKENMKHHSPSGETLPASGRGGFVQFTREWSKDSRQEKHHQPAAASSASPRSYSRVSHRHLSQLLELKKTPSKQKNSFVCV